MTKTILPCLCGMGFLEEIEFFWQKIFHIRSKEVLQQKDLQLSSSKTTAINLKRMYWYVELSGPALQFYFVFMLAVCGLRGSRTIWISLIDWTVDQRADFKMNLFQTYWRYKLFLLHLHNTRLPRWNIYSSRRSVFPRRPKKKTEQKGEKTFGMPLSGCSQTQSQMNADICIASSHRSPSNVAFNALFARMWVTAAAGGWWALRKKKEKRHTQTERHPVSFRQGGAWNFLAFQTRSITEPSSKVLAAGYNLKLLWHV